MMNTTLNYVALRLLGEGTDGGKDGAIEKARNWILDHGGATMIPSWGKAYLSVLGLYEWSGCNPMPPELWLLPSYLPLAPGKSRTLAGIVLDCKMDESSDNYIKRKQKAKLFFFFYKLTVDYIYLTIDVHSARLWSYMRNFFAPLSYLYGKKFVGPISELIVSLRDEIYTQSYEKIDWNKARHLCSEVSIVCNIQWFRAFLKAHKSYLYLF